MAHQWTDYNPTAIADRYDRIAGVIGAVDWLLFMPPGLRARAARRLELKRGDHVLEIGCGTGRNFPFLQEAVGSQGKIYGVDLSAGVLQRARALCEQRRWHNVTLMQGDAAEFRAQEPLDGVLFGFSYNTIPHHLRVLHHALQQLRPGGRVVIVDAKLPAGRAGRLLLPFSLWLMKSTMLGNPLIKPWHHLAEATEGFEMEEFLFGCWYVCWGIKAPRIVQAGNVPYRNDLLHPTWSRPPTVPRRWGIGNSEY